MNPDGAAIIAASEAGPDAVADVLDQQAAAREAQAAQDVEKQSIQLVKDAKKMSDSELKKEVGDIHEAKDSIMKDFGKQLDKKDTNFDILKDKNGDMVLKGNKSGKLVQTNLKPSAYNTTH